MINSNHKIAVIGLGYVGLPLAVEFAKKYKVVGFDINTQRVAELNKCEDKTLELSSEVLKKVLLTQKNYISDKCTALLLDNKQMEVYNDTVLNKYHLGGLVDPIN